MNRRQVLSGLGAGLLGARVSAFGQQESDILSRFAAVDWRRHAVMTLPPGVDPPWRLRVEAEYEAARQGAEARDRLLHLTEHASPHVRGFAAQMLGVIGEARSIDRLRALSASDPSALARNYAVEALSRLLGAPANRTVVSAIAAAREDENGNVQFAAEQAELRLRKRVSAGTALRAEWARGFDRGQLASARLGRPAPEFRLTADDGRTVRLRDYRDRSHVVLLFQLADW